MKTHTMLSIVAIFAALQGCSQQKPAIVSECFLDALEGAGKLPDGNFVAIPNAKLTAQGWFADVPSGKSPDKVSLILVSENGSVFLQGSAATGVARPDIAQVFKKDSLKNSGFSIGFQLNKDLPNSQYAIVLNGEFDGKVGVCTTKRTIKIAN